MRIVMFALLAFVLSACNTVQGFGKDVQKVGNSMEKAASKHTD